MEQGMEKDLEYGIEQFERLGNVSFKISADHLSSPYHQNSVHLKEILHHHLYIHKKK